MNKTRHDWVGKVIHWELCKKLKFDHANKWCMHNSESVQENEMHKLLGDFEIQTDHIISGRWPDLVIVQKKKRKEENSTNCELSCRANYREELKESEKKDEYLDVASALKKLGNMKVTVIPTVIGACRTVSKGRVLGLEDLKIREWVETIKTTALLRSTKILRRVLETWGDLLSFIFQWEPIG